MSDIIVHLKDIAQLFKDAEEHWKAQAFIKAATALSKHPPLQFKGGVLQDQIPGIGKAIKEVIEQFTATGTSEKFKKLTAEAKPKLGKVEFLQEVTDWSEAGCYVPNHTYIFDGDKCVGYIKEGTTEKSMFSKPSSGFSKRGRKFKTLTPAAAKQAGYIS